MAWSPATPAPSTSTRAGGTWGALSLCPKGSTAVAAGVAPTAAYASSANDAASPAPRSTTTGKPAFTSRPATSGVKATRRSLAAVSFGTPILMQPQDDIGETTTLSVLRHPWLVIMLSVTDDG